MIIFVIIIWIWTGNIKTLADSVNEMACNPIKEIIEKKTNKSISSSASMPLNGNTGFYICSFKYTNSKFKEKEVSFEINYPLLKKNDISYEYLEIWIPKFKDYVNLIEND